MIPVFSPDITQDDLKAVQDSLVRGEISGSFSKEITLFEEEFAKFSDCQYGVAVSNGTNALQLAVRALSLEPGSEILMSASTNIATALAAFYNNCVTVPVDSESTSWNLDISLLESLITKKTRAIIVVHLLGCPVDMPRVLEIAKKHGISVIEDAAEAHAATWDNKKVGSFGDLSCFSFYANKIITTGEGGMITTNNHELAKKCSYLKNLAHGTPRFLHKEAGYNFRMPAPQAALGRSQLKRIGTLLRERASVADYYDKVFSELNWVEIQTTPAKAFNSRWAYGLVLKDGKLRDPLMQHLKDSGIDTRTMFCPMNLQPFLHQNNLMKHLSCPVAERLWQSGLQIPIGYGLQKSDLEHISNSICEFKA